MLVSAKDMMDKARDGKYAVGQFNINNLEQTKALISYSRRIGIAFQIADDILDVTGDERTMGKTLHKDEKQNKLTFVSLYGLENARRIAAELTAAAREDVAVFGSHARNLQNLASYIIERQH